MAKVHARWSKDYTYCDASIEGGIKAVNATTTRRITCARCRTVFELALAAGGPMRGEGSPDNVFESSYDSMINRYRDLFTPEYEAIRHELNEISSNVDAGDTSARRRAEILRTRLAEMYDDIPCRCDCGDIPCECRRCLAGDSNAYQLSELRQPAKRRTNRRAKAQAELPPTPTLPEGPRASRARHRRLAKTLYLMAGLDGEAFNTWLINETDRDIEFTELTGEFGPGASAFGVTRPARTVPARSALLFEEDSYWGLDWSAWWEIAIIARDDAILRFRASRGKYGYSDESLYEPIPYTDKRGMRIDFRFSDE